jgi:hypothetical protein
MATFDPFNKSKVAKIEEGTSLAKKLKIEIDASLIVEKAIDPVIISQITYYIIGGAFAEKNNAIKMLNNIDDKYYNSEIIEGSNLLRVSYDYFFNREEAILALSEIKKENQDAWLLTN